MARVFLSGIATLLVLIGTLAPIPGGTVILGAGTALLICSSEFVVRCIREFRSRFQRINGWITWMENRMGERLGGIIRSNRPQEA